VNITGCFTRAILKVIRQFHNGMNRHTPHESNQWPVFTSLKNSYPNRCVFGTILEMSCPCGTTPFQQLINNDWQFPGLPQSLHCTGLTSDPLQNQTEDKLREVDLDCKVTGKSSLQFFWITSSVEVQWCIAEQFSSLDVQQWMKVLSVWG